MRLLPRASGVAVRPRTVRRALRNVATALTAGVGEVFGEDMPMTPTTLYGVHSLFEPAALVEIDVIAEL